MDFPRASGILLHPTSLPGKYGIGDLGTELAGLGELDKLELKLFGKLWFGRSYVSEPAAGFWGENLLDGNSFLDLVLPPEFGLALLLLELGLVL